MSVQSEITRIQNNVDNSLAAVAAYGVTVPVNATSDDLAGLIAKITDKVINKDNLSLGIASDGLIYIFVDGTPIGTGIPQGQSGDVFGYVDENNTVTLTGNLPDGTYSVKYEMENGTKVNIGNLVLDTNVYYTVTNTLTNCTNNNSATRVAQGSSYSATITANSGYTLKSVTVTMGGQSVAVSGGTINIANVTGNIVITAVAEEVKTEPTNQIPLYVGANGEKGYKTNVRVSGSSGNESTTSASGLETTGFIPFKYGQNIYIKDITFEAHGYQNVVYYNADKAIVVGIQCDLVFGGAKSGEIAVAKDIKQEGWYADTAKLASISYIRMTAKVIDDNSIITIDEPLF